jgi:hypothetical protein
VEEANAAIGAGADIIMLDNFTPEGVREAAAQLSSTLRHSTSTLVENPPVALAACTARGIAAAIDSIDDGYKEDNAWVPTCGEIWDACWRRRPAPP